MTKSVAIQNLKEIADLLNACLEDGHLGPAVKSHILYKLERTVEYIEEEIAKESPNEN